MIINKNIHLSKKHNFNVFSNNYYYDHNAIFKDSLIFDIHPLYGYIDSHNNIKYVWSYGYYLINPQYFHTFKFECSNDNNNILVDNKKQISYFIVFESLDESYIQNLIETIKKDIQHMYTIYTNKIVIYSYFKVNALDEHFQITYNFNTISIIKISCFLMCNTYCQIFMLAYTYGVNVVCFDKKDDFMSIFFINDLNTNVNIINANISKFVLLIEYFTVDNIGCCNFLKNHIIKPLLSVEFKFLNSKKWSTYDNIYLHGECKHMYHSLRKGIIQSNLNLVTEFCENTFCCFLISENTMSKMLCRKNTNFLVFDDNKCVYVKNDKITLIRYYYCHFNNKSLQQHHNLSDFIYKKNISVFDQGIILCILDNSSGLFYKNVKEWYDIWHNVLKHISTRYTNSVVVKLHPNDANNLYFWKLKEIYNFDITPDELDVFFSKHKMFFCVLQNGSSYLKCLQHGIVAFSFTKYDETKCVYALSDSIDEKVKTHYTNHRYETFKNELNRLVNMNDVLNGKFFTQLRDSLQ